MRSQRRTGGGKTSEKVSDSNPSTPVVDGLGLGGPSLEPGGLANAGEGGKTDDGGKTTPPAKKKHPDGGIATTSEGEGGKTSEAISISDMNMINEVVEGIVTMNTRGRQSLGLKTITSVEKGKNTNEGGTATPPTQSKHAKNSTQTPSQSSQMDVNEAYKCINRHSQSSTYVVNNTMWLYLWPLYLNHDQKLVTSMVDCNWNVWNEKLGLEITHNIIANAKGENTKYHAPSAGHDMTILMADGRSVRFCKCLHFVVIYKIDPFFGG